MPTDTIAIIISILALFIALLSTITSVISAKVALDKQSLTLRPFIYVADIQKVAISAGKLVLQFNIKNCGLVLARNVRISYLLIPNSGSAKKYTGDNGIIVMPNQTYCNELPLDGDNADDILKADNVTISIFILYQGGRQKYEYQIDYNFIPKNGLFSTLGGDAT